MVVIVTGGKQSQLLVFWTWLGLEFDNINYENETSKLFSGTVDISIDSDTMGDTYSDESELNTSDEKEYQKHLKDESMSSSEEEDVINNCSLITDSFFT